MLCYGDTTRPRTVLINKQARKSYLSLISLGLGDYNSFWCVDIHVRVRLGSSYFISGYA